MAHRFKRHYTREEAKSLLPTVSRWIEQLTIKRRQASDFDEMLLKRVTRDPNDHGGPDVNAWITTLSEIKDLLRCFSEKEIQIKDLERGLIDFPAFVGGREVFLCWEKGEEDIEYWHDLDSGFGTREPL